MPEDIISDDFLEAVSNFHNPETLFKMAKTDFEKAVAIEFFMVSKHFVEQDNEIKWLKYLVKAVFGVGVLGILIEVIPKIFGM